MSHLLSQKDFICQHINDEKKENAECYIKPYYEARLICSSWIKAFVKHIRKKIERTRGRKNRQQEKQNTYNEGDY
jgi:hypothetical protein